jgi:hypothetical protein
MDRVSVRDSSKPTAISPKVRGHKLRSGIHWQGALKEKGAKHVGRKTRATCNHMPLEGLKLTMTKGKRESAFIEFL